MTGRTHLGSLAFAATALILGGCVFGGGDDDPEATATAEVTPSATSVATSEPTGEPTGTATAVAGLPPGLAATESGAWTSAELSAGDEVPDGPGVFVFDTGSGAGTLWSFDAEVAPGRFAGRTGASPNGAFVTEFGLGPVLNTATGDSFTWTGGSRFRSIDDRGFAVFTGRTGCTLWLVDLSGAEPELVVRTAFPTELTQGDCAVATQVGPDAAELVVAVQGDSTGGLTSVYAVDLESGAAELVAEVEAGSLRRDEVASGADGMVFTGRLPATAVVARYSWADRELVTTSIDTGATAGVDDVEAPPPSSLKVSPDGRWVAWQGGADLGTGLGLGGLAEWPATVIASVTDGAVALRADRVAMTTGIKSFDWLSDSSALVVQSEAGFGLLGTDGTLTDLPFPIAQHSGPVPIPAPDRTDWFAYDGRVVDETGAGVGEVPAVAGAWSDGIPDGLAGWWNATRYGWGKDSGRLILVRTVVDGRDFGRGGIAVIGLPARIVAGADATATGPISLLVAADGDRLNVRDVPGLDGERIGQFDDGAVVTIGRDTSIDFCGENGCSILNDPDLEYGEGWWIYVTGAGTEGDLAGWVSSEFLDWAQP